MRHPGMPWWGVVALCIASSAGAQDIAAFGASSPRAYDQRSLEGVGVSLAAHFKLGSVFHPARSHSRFNANAGVRVAIAMSGATEETSRSCPDVGVWAGPATDAVASLSCVGGREVHTRFYTQQLTLLLAPWLSTLTRLDMSAGATRYVYQSRFREAGMGLNAGVEFSRRFDRHSPFWLTVGYERYGWLLPAFVDWSFLPRHGLRLGIAFRPPRESDEPAPARQ